MTGTGNNGMEPKSDRVRGRDDGASAMIAGGSRGDGDAASMPADRSRRDGGGNGSVPTKPAGSAWTDDQWDAIVTGGRNVLVAAAAGSGKTAVLVERIIRRISTDTDVDRLLVATFTKAAAAEMKERITLALEKELAHKPDSEHLRRQLALMGRASITTLHSFCLDVIRRYYPLIGLDPGFRIANETESELLRLDVLDELFEHKYSGEAGSSGPFLALADRYGGERGDEPLYRLVGQLYDFAQSHPWPEHWLRTTAASFAVSSVDELERGVWVRSLHDDVLLSLEGARSLLEEGLRLADLPGGPAPYAATFRDDLAFVRELLRVVATEPWRRWGEAFRTAAFGKLKAMRGDEYDKALQEQAKELRDGAKKLVAELVDELFGRTPEQFMAELAELAPLMGELAELVVEFDRRYERAKREKGLLDFGDLEHYCLCILRHESSTPEALVPSVAALEYRRQFDEILLDEYQDTNMVQEAIVSLIARPGAGNRFMVGDVKQSIYRFRLAEPNLFLAKYKAYRTRDGSAPAQPDTDGPGEGHDGGLRIDLARNFRSRSEVVDGVNAVFRAIMREKVAEMDYDRRAELVCGASYPEASPPGSCKVRFALLDRGGSAEDGASEQTYGGVPDDEEGDDGSGGAEEAEELKAAQLEARWIGSQLRGLTDGGFRVYDGKRKAYRPLQWRDVVILLRATRQWAPIVIEELQGMGIPAYAELGSGYFEATEVVTMLSLLRIIDNPYQDIPLAAVLRSPLFAMDAEQLSRIRILSPGAAYYDAVLRAAGDERLDAELRGKLSRFLDKLDHWREEARGGALADLIWQIYGETGYYDFAGGLPGGAQRQANLRALHDRARQYEATSFRGLFRFLRFIERMQDSGGDLGTARALGEQEDVVRIMSIHRSKGLEFPVVFVAGLGKLFNQQDLRSAFLKHKELGFGPRYIDPDERVSYPTLPFLAIRRALRTEMLAEEMRILYVALTRPKEKLFLVGTVADAEKKLKNWSGALDAAGNVTDFRVASARSFLDWLGPMASAEMLRNAQGAGAGLQAVWPPGPEAGGQWPAESDDPLSAVPPRAPSAAAAPDWAAHLVPAAVFSGEAAAALEEHASSDAAAEERVQAMGTLALLDGISPDEELRRRLEWVYPHEAAASMAAKTSVTEMKRLHAEVPADAAMLSERAGEPGEWPDFGRESGGAAAAEEAAGAHADAARPLPPRSAYTLRLRRPSFMEEKSLAAAERGSVSHLLMQHIPLTGTVDERTVRETLESMVDRRLLTARQAESVDTASVAAFFESGLGQRLLAAGWVRREIPFSCMFPASRVYEATGQAPDDEPIMIQGVIDCLFRDERGLALVDYKTDRVYMGQWDRAAERHRFQLELYGEAIGTLLGSPVDELYVYFFDGGRSVKL